MGLKRRTFLQQTGLVLAALGVSETVLSLLGEKSLAVPLLERYFQVLAQPTGRKLALLVGINQYPHSTALAGCVTDVELQRELLIHRFGFNPSDILTLTDRQATRENIETTFLEHLTEQAKAGDVVLFHFSGYGSRVHIASPKQELGGNSQEKESDLSIASRVSPSQAYEVNSLVPVDSIEPNKEKLLANDVLEDTLVLLLRSLATDHVTTVLDTSYTPAQATLQGTLRVRSSPNPPATAPSPGELAFQQQIRLHSNLLGDKLKNSENLNQIPGIVLAASGPSQPATEAQWRGFSAGLFTYALTQHLWQAFPATTIQISLSRAAGTVNQLVGKEQQPRLISKKSPNQPLLAYYLPPDPSIGADGVVTAVEENGRTAQLWLAGLPATVLEYYGSNCVLTLAPAKLAVEQLKVEDNLENLQPSNQPLGNTSDKQLSTPEKPQLQIRSKEGLTAKAQILGISGTENYALQVGQLVQEAIRVLPRHLGLTLALDANLERIERVDATSAFATIAYVSSVVTAGEQPADYLFGKVSLPQPAAPTPAASLSDSAPSSTEASVSLTRTEGYGLFYLAREPIRNTAGDVGEAVKSAVNRLTPKLKTLLAAKLLRLTANEGSSRLGIRASLEIITPEPKVIMQRETLRASLSSQVLADKKTKDKLTSPMAEGSIPTLSIGSRIQYRLENYSSSPIYYMLLGFDTNSNAIAFYKIQSSPQADESENKLPLISAAIAPGETLTLPKSLEASSWIVSGPVGLAEIQLICCREPFTKAIAALEVARRPKGDGEQLGDLFNPLEVAQAVLQDLHTASTKITAKTSSYALDSIGTVSDTYALDVNAWATLSFIYQVV